MTTASIREPTKKEEGQRKRENSDDGERAEEINKKQKIIILLNETKYNFRKQQKVILNKVDLSINNTVFVFGNKYRKQEPNKKFSGRTRKFLNLNTENCI
jgi:hypothetical protein